MSAAELVVAGPAMLGEGILVAGRFRLGKLLGQGGMGAVFDADDEHIDRRVALKVLTVSGAKALARFREEARAASRISSRHVAAVHDFGHDTTLGVSFMVLEKLDGHTLDEVLARQSPLDPSTTAAIGAEIAEALSAAHAANVVHRDLKPSNIWMLAGGGVKVFDFGIARIASEELAAPGLTAPNKILGTPRYISPEAVDAQTVGPPADLYALGVMLFEMVTGTVPFDDEVPVILCGKHLKDPPPEILERAPDLRLPASFQDLVSALLEKDPRRRPRSALEVAEQLRAMTDVEGAVRISGIAITPGAITAEVSRRPPPMPARPAHLRIALVIMLVIAVALTGAVVTLWSLPAAVDDGPGAAEVTEPSELDEADEADAPGEAELIEPASPPTVPAQQPPDLQIEVVLVPRSATLLLDGEPVEAPFAVAPDGAVHELEGRARGYQRSRATFVADRDQSVTLTLRRQPEPEPVPNIQDHW